MIKTDWEINIHNTASSVARKHGHEVVISVFARYDASSFEDLNPIFYNEVFGDLMLIDENE